MNEFAYNSYRKNRDLNFPLQNNMLADNSHQLFMNRLQQKFGSRQRNVCNDDKDDTSMSSSNEDEDDQNNNMNRYKFNCVKTRKRKFDPEPLSSESSSTEPATQYPSDHIENKYFSTNHKRHSPHIDQLGSPDQEQHFGIATYCNSLPKFQYLDDGTTIMKNKKHQQQATKMSKKKSTKKYSQVNSTPTLVHSKVSSNYISSNQKQSQSSTNRLSVNQINNSKRSKCSSTSHKNQQKDRGGDKRLKQTASSTSIQVEKLQTKKIKELVQNQQKKTSIIKQNYKKYRAKNYKKIGSPSSSISDIVEKPIRIKRSGPIKLLGEFQLGFTLSNEMKMQVEKKLSQKSELKVEKKLSQKSELKVEKKLIQKKSSIDNDNCDNESDSWEVPTDDLIGYNNIQSIFGSDSEDSECENKTTESKTCDINPTNQKTPEHHINQSTSFKSTTTHKSQNHDDVNPPFDEEEHHHQNKILKLEQYTNLSNKKEHQPIELERNLSTNQKERRSQQQPMILEQDKITNQKEHCHELQSIKLEQENYWSNLMDRHHEEQPIESMQLNDWSDDRNDKLNLLEWYHSMSDHLEEQGEQLSLVDFAKYTHLDIREAEKKIYDRYCLIRPNAMKFLAHDYAQKWESKRQANSQLNEVPIEFMQELFYRALYCLGLEKKAISESLVSGINSPISTSEYRKVRDEYAFSLKRVRHGLSILDGLFQKCSQISPLIDLTPQLIQTIRKWRHIVYYLCLQAKAVFIVKEFQFHTFATAIISPPPTTNNNTTTTTSSNTCINNISSLSSNCTLNPSSMSLSVSSNNSNSNNEEYYSCEMNDHDEICGKLTDTTFKSLLASYAQSMPISSSSNTVPNPSNVSLPKCSNMSLNDDSYLDFSPPQSHDSGKASSISTNQSNSSSTQHHNFWPSSSSSSVSSSSALFSDYHHLLQQTMFRIDEYMTSANQLITTDPRTSYLHKQITRQAHTEPAPNSTRAIIRFICYFQEALKFLTESSETKENINLPDCLHQIMMKTNVQLQHTAS